jgi:hypothetical protein
MCLPLLCHSSSFENEEVHNLEEMTPARFFEPFKTHVQFHKQLLEALMLTHAGADWNRFSNLNLTWILILQCVPRGLNFKPFKPGFIWKPQLKLSLARISKFHLPPIKGPIRVKCLIDEMHLFKSTANISQKCGSKFLRSRWFQHICWLIS